MTELLTRELDRAPVVDVDVDTRRVTVRLCRWNDPRTVVDPGGARYREAFAPGDVELGEHVHVVDHHHGVLIGRGDPGSFRDDGDGPTVDLILARTAAASDTLALIEADVIRSVSMEFAPGATEVRDGVVWRSARVEGVAFAFRPAHDADILATRETTTTESDPTMTTTTPAADPVELPADPADIAVTTEVLTRSLDELRDDLSRTFIADRPTEPTASPLTMHRSLGEYALAAYADPSDPLLRRALADQITTDNPGVIPPGWVNEVQGILDFGSPTITAFGRSPLPADGMTVDWPYYDGDLSTLVGEQTAEKTEITTAVVSLLRGSTDIRTFAGGSDISYALLRRSSPAYLTAYLRIMSAAYGLATDNAAAADIATAASPSAVPFDPAAGDYADLVAALVVASTEVEAATGAPATFALAGTDVFVAAAVAQATASTQSSSVQGSATAARLAVNVSGLPIIHDRQLADDALIVSNPQAATWYSEGPFTATAEDVEKLGQNVAVWGMGAMALTAAAGIRIVEAV